MGRGPGCGSVSAKPSRGASIGKSGGRSVFLVESCDNLTLENLTIENTYSIPSHKGQAETIYFNSSYKLTVESGVKDGSMYLARSGGSTDYFDNVVFVNCTMGPVIAPAGWHTNPAPNPSVPTATAGWREFGSVDTAGKAVTGHNASGKVLTATEAEPYSSRKAVLGW